MRKDTSIGAGSGDIAPSWIPNGDGVTDEGWDG